MNSPNTRSLPLPLAYQFLIENGLQNETEILKSSFPGKDLSIRRAKRGFASDILRSKGLLDKFIAQFWPNGLTEDGKRRLETYRHWYEELRTVPPEEEDEDPGIEADRFAYEQDLRDYLANYPAIIEPGLSLWPVGENERAIEFRVDGGRRIDILAKDRHGTPVIIELKVSHGHERVIGQALYYRGCIKEKFAAPKVRIVIIAREITPELRIATRDLSDVELFEYKLAVTLSKIAVTTRTEEPSTPAQPA